jgi:hypothetical protein
VSTTPCRVTPPLGARAQHMTASTIPPLSVWPWHALMGATGLRYPSVRPNHLAAPSRWRVCVCASARAREREVTEREREREREKSLLTMK